MIFTVYIHPLTRGLPDLLFFFYYSYRVGRVYSADKDIFSVRYFGTVYINVTQLIQFIQGLIRFMCSIKGKEVLIC